MHEIQKITVKLVDSQTVSEKEKDIIREKIRNAIPFDCEITINSTIV